MPRSSNSGKIQAMIIILLTALLNFPFLCGCNKSPVYTKAEFPAKCRFEYSVNGIIFSGTMKTRANKPTKTNGITESKTAEKNAEFTFDSPDSLNGVIIKIRDGESQLTLINQIFTENCNKLPYGFVPARLCDLFFTDISSLTPKTDDGQNLIYSVFSGDKDAELVFEKETGLLCEVRLENTVVKITDSFVNGTDITE